VELGGLVVRGALVGSGSSELEDGEEGGEDGKGEHHGEGRRGRSERLVDRERRGLGGFGSERKEGGEEGSGWQRKDRV
jgi:hypothetical protein